MRTTTLKLIFNCNFIKDSLKQINNNTNSKKNKTLVSFNYQSIHILININSWLFWSRVFHNLNKKLLTPWEGKPGNLVFFPSLLLFFHFHFNFFFQEYFTSMMTINYFDFFFIIIFKLPSVLIHLKMSQCFGHMGK